MNNKNQGGGPWWKPAVALMGEVSTWVVVPIVLALIVGKALDKHFGTAPVAFLALTVFAFAISSYGIVREVSRYMRKVEKESNNLWKDKTQPTDSK